MMARWLFALTVWLMLSSPGYAQTTGNPYVVSSCGSAAVTYPAGQYRPVTMDVNGNICGANSVVPAPIAGITAVKSTAAESGHVLKATPGNLYSLTATALTATAGYVMVFNSATVPADGAVTPVLCLPINALPGLVNINYNPGPPGAFSTGISTTISSTGCATKTAIASGAWFTGAVQ